MERAEHLQQAEVTEFLKKKPSCAIVQGVHEVSVCAHPTGLWHVIADVKELSAEVKKKLKAAGLKARRREMHMAFGPMRGKTIVIFQVVGEFSSVAAAAHAALSLFDMLWSIPATDWLWVTESQPDDRDAPKQPANWPPSQK